MRNFKLKYSKKFLKNGHNSLLQIDTTPDNNIIHNYDIIIGPIADDGVALQIGLFKDGYINLATLAETLKYRKLNNQYYFGTPKAIKLLKRL